MLEDQGSFQQIISYVSRLGELSIQLTFVTIHNALAVSFFLSTSLL